MDFLFPVKIRCQDGTETFRNTFGEGVQAVIALAIETGREYVIYNRVTGEAVVYIGRAESKTDAEIETENRQVDNRLHQFIDGRRQEMMGEAVRKGIINGSQGVDLLRLWTKMDEARR